MKKGISFDLLAKMYLSGVDSLGVSQKKNIFKTEGV